MLTALPLGAFSTWAASVPSTGVRCQCESSMVRGIRRHDGGIGVHGADGGPDGHAVEQGERAGEMATLYLHNENFTRKAIEYLDEAIALSPRSADLYNLRGIAHSKRETANVPTPISGK